MILAILILKILDKDDIFSKNVSPQIFISCSGGAVAAAAGGIAASGRLNPNQTI